MRHQWRPALGILLILLLSPWSSFIQTEPEESTTLVGDEFEQFSIRTDAYSDFVGELDSTVAQEQRAIEADSRIGVFTLHGLETSRPLSSDVLEPRNDVRLFLVNNDRNLIDVRSELSEIQGIEVREYISPSGFLVQGTVDGFNSAMDVDGIEGQLLVPLAMFLDDVFLDTMLFEQGTATLVGQEIRLEGWRDEQTLDVISIEDSLGSTIEQDINDVATLAMDDVVKLDDGRYRGLLFVDDVLDIVRQPSVMWLRYEPQMAFSNDQSKNHMKITTMRSYFTTDLDGSGQIVAVADSGLDEDHGDFGTRVVGNFDVIGDGSTADKHSGHGTHVACTVLGDGSKGGYAGVAPDAELYFQAMENDNTGNFQSPSLNYLLNTAYNSGARIHTNSWGSSAASNQGKYTSESEDVDDRANNYDRVYNGVEGLTILFAAGNDGPNAGTVGSPSTAKNSITVGQSSRKIQWRS